MHCVICGKALNKPAAMTSVSGVYGPVGPKCARDIGLQLARPAQPRRVSMQARSQPHQQFNPHQFALELS